MNREAGIFGCLDYVDSNCFHRRSGPEGMSARFREGVAHTPLAEDAAPPNQSGSKTHPFLEGRRFYGFDDLKKLEFEGTM